MYSLNVSQNGKFLDRVFYEKSAGETVAQFCERVKTGLVSHDGFPADISVKLQKGQRVTVDSFDLEGDYGSGYEILTSESTFKEARIRKKEYLENSPCPLRIVKRRDKK